MSSGDNAGQVEATGNKTVFVNGIMADHSKCLSYSYGCVCLINVCVFRVPWPFSVYQSPLLFLLV